MLKAEIRQQLVDHYLDFYTLAYSMLADKDDARDAVQEALTHTMAKRRLDDPMNYCYQAVRHSAIDIIRHRSRFVHLESQMLDEIVKDEPVENDSYSQLLNRATHLRDKLPSALRALVILHDEKGLSYERLAKLTGMSSMTIRRRLNEVHVKMKKELKNKKETTI